MDLNLTGTGKPRVVKMVEEVARKVRERFPNAKLELYLGVYVWFLNRQPVAEAWKSKRGFSFRIIESLPVSRNGASSNGSHATAVGAMEGRYKLWKY